ncbi:MAG: AAA family ATPase [Desulfovibrionaceae bacterium]|nr:AAA family ATPase [Desulfovibrionaceae bacterium]
MAHSHTELEFGPGVTVLTGPNNTGKSAVVEALRCVATNPTPSHFLRHGAKEARVGVEMEDGTRVVWVRTKRWAMYELWRPGAEEPEEYHKLQRKVPEDIQNVLRMNQVDLETSSRPVDIHIGNQREPVFLLNRPDSDAAAFFAASTESAHLLAMQDLLKLQVRDRKREEEALVAEAGRIENDLDGLASLPSIELRLDEARVLEAESVRLEREVPALESLLAQMNSLRFVLDARRRGAAVLAEVEPPPRPEDARRLAEILASLDRAARHLGAARHAAGALGPLEGPPPVENTALLARTADALRATGDSLGKVEGQHAALAALEAVPVLDDTAGLAELLDEFLILRHRAVRLDRWSGVLREIKEPPAVESGEGMGALLAGMRSLSGRIAAQSTALGDLEKDLRKVADRLADRVGELGRCPTCGQAVKASDFLDHGGCHDA